MLSLDCYERSEVWETIAPTGWRQSGNGSVLGIVGSGLRQHIKKLPAGGRRGGRKFLRETYYQSVTSLVKSHLWGAEGELVGVGRSRGMGCGTEAMALDSGLETVQIEVDDRAL